MSSSSQFSRSFGDSAAVKPALKLSPRAGEEKEGESQRAGASPRRRSSTAAAYPRVLSSSSKTRRTPPAAMASTSSPTLILDNGAHSIKALWANNSSPPQCAFHPPRLAELTAAAQDLPQRHHQVQDREEELRRGRAGGVRGLWRARLPPPI